MSSQFYNTVHHPLTKTPVNEVSDNEVAVFLPSLLGVRIWQQSWLSNAEVGWGNLALKMTQNKKKQEKVNNFHLTGCNSNYDLFSIWLPTFWCIFIELGETDNQADVQYRGAPVR